MEAFLHLQTVANLLERDQLICGIVYGLPICSAWRENRVFLTGNNAELDVHGQDIDAGGDGDSAEHRPVSKDDEPSAYPDMVGRG